MADTQVSTNGGSNLLHGILALADGGHRTFWAGPGLDGTSDIFSRRSGVDGQPIGPAEIINTLTAGRQANALVTKLTNDGYVVSWTSQPPGGAILPIYQIYDAEGLPVGPQVQIAGALTVSVLEGLAGGGFLIGYRVGSSNPNATFVFEHRSDTGSIVSQATAAWVSQMQGFALDDGSFVTLSPSGSNLQATHYTVSEFSMTPSGPAVTLELSPGVRPGAAVFAALGLADGGYVVGWTATGNLNDVYMRKFSAAGVALTDSILVNAETDFQQYNPVLVALPDGGFFFIWTSITSTSPANDAYGQRFDASGAKVGSEILLSESNIGDQVGIDAALAGDGSLIVAWRTGSGVQPSDIVQTHLDITDGDSGANTLTGSGLRDLMYAMGGDDTLSGLGGADILDGGLGTDTVSYAGYGAGVDVSLMVSGQQLGTLDTLISIENLTGSGFADSLTGNAGANVLRGLGGADTLLGGEGADVLDGGAGNDLLTGGAGADAIVFRASEGKSSDRIFGFSAQDVLVTDVAIFDNNGDGVIAFSSNKKLNLAGGNVVTITNEANKAIQALEFDGVFHNEATGQDYYVYSLIGSAAGVHTVAGV